MSWRELLKPTIGKIILFLILMGGLNYIWISSSGASDAKILVGLPFGFWPIGSFYVQTGGPTPPIVGFSWINIVIDIIFWYLVSCGVVFLYYKARKK